MGREIAQRIDFARWHNREVINLRQQLSPEFSAYLDLIRLAAALIVMLAHAAVSELIILPPLILDLAPLAVVIFFVLSGYIIEATTEPTLGLRHYAVHRAARIYSVAIPAVALSFLISGLFASRAETDWAAYQQNWLQWWRIADVLTFQAEDWFSAVEVPWNGPFWSLHYEVFYYCLYAALTFSRGFSRATLVAMLCAIAGPKILLLLPCWWIGVELARRPSIRFHSNTTALFALVGSHLFIVVLAASHLGHWLQRKIIGLDGEIAAFDHSTLFVTDYMAAASVAAGFIAARQLFHGNSSRSEHWRKGIRSAAGYTFSIYLLHRPLQTLASQFFRVQPAETGKAWALQWLILGIIICIGSITERRVQSWRRLFSKLLPECAVWPGRSAATS